MERCSGGLWADTWHPYERLRSAGSSRIAAALTYVARRRRDALASGGWWLDDLRYVEARPAVPVAYGDWRTVLAGQLGEQRPSNQARAERLRAGNPVEDGLAFASTAELTVYRALKQLQPLPPPPPSLTMSTSSCSNCAGRRATSRGRPRGVGRPVRREGRMAGRRPLASPEVTVARKGSYI